MCVLCSGFVVQEHWTDRISENRGELVVSGGGLGRDRQRQRILRVAMANRVLACYGLKVEDWQGSKYILRDVKGNSEIVQDLGALWPAVESMAKRKVDPLDPDFIERLNQSTNRK